VIAILLDQPYGPVLVAALLIIGIGRTIARRWCVFRFDVERGLQPPRRDRSAG
jgi:hypothetical protein